MRVHDWSRVDGGLFHDFHNTWLAHIKESLNAGLLPVGYYARVEQHVGRIGIPDLLTLSLPRGRNGAGGPPAGAVAVAETPPRVRTTRQLRLGPPARTRAVAVRRTGGDDIVAVIEVVSPANKDREDHVSVFVGKVGALLQAGVHVAVIDLLPPTRHTPGGLHQTVADDFGLPREEDDETIQPADTPIALLSYESEMPDIQTYIDYLRVGDPLPDMPLFLAPGYYVRLPLGPTYEQTFRGLGQVDRDRIAPPAP